MKNNPNRLIRLDGVLNIIPYSKSTIYGFMPKGLFPQSFKIGERATAWKESDILALTKALSEEKTQSEVKELVKSLNESRTGRNEYETQI
jgi:prophage regulatory protein